LLQIPLRKLDRLKPEPAELDRYEMASREDIRTLQRERLAWSLRHAYDNVPHYRAKFDAAGVHPDQFKDLPDLAKFPFTLKTDLRDNYPFGMFAVPDRRLRAFTRHPARPESRRLSAIPNATSKRGATWSPARSALRAAVPA
jgi:phenylacetate-CoA ligase